MIMSLKAGNLGLNMVAACHVILLDLWWNPYAEDQAIDRAHRIGQTRAVTVSRLTIKESVEDRILALQVIICGFTSECFLLAFGTSKLQIGFHKYLKLT
jgi:SNF2 family DNA or RNA helicase